MGGANAPDGYAKLKEGASYADDKGTCTRTTQREEIAGPERRGSVAAIKRGQLCWTQEGGQLRDEKGENKDAQNSPAAYNSKMLISHIKTVSVTDGPDCWIS
jgi:hypothetical protein